MRVKVRRRLLVTALFSFVTIASVLNWRAHNTPTVIRQQLIDVAENSAIINNNNNSATVLLNQQRLQHLADVCKRYKNMAATGNRTFVATEPGWTPGPVDDMLVDDKLKYMYCPVGKVATRSWKYVLLRAAGSKVSMGKADNRYIIETYLPQLRNFNANGSSLLRLQTYYKFMVVREPMERFVSAYNYLFQGSPFYQRSVGSEIIKRYRANNVTENRRKVLIEELVRFVIDEYRAGSDLDRHWRPQYELCHPCQVNYNYVGHYETLESDADAILRSIGVLDRIQFPFRNRKRTTAKVLKNALERVPADQLRELIRVYEPDYELFGFEKPDW